MSGLYTIKMYNSYFTVKTSYNDPIVNILKDKLSTYTFIYNKKYKRYKRELDKTYYAYDNRNHMYRFPIELLKPFMIHLGQSGVKKENIYFKIFKDPYIIEPLGLETNPNLTPRDYQEKYISSLIDNYTNHFSSLVDLQTGQGKTLLSIFALCRLNVKFGIIVAPKFLDKWVSDVKFLTNIKDEEICVLQGSDSLRKLMYDDQPEYKIYIFSTRTLSMYIKEYEEIGEFTYPITPDMLCHHLHIGALLNDEAHLEFHAVFKTMLYFNVQHLIGMSATLHAKDPKIKYLHKLLYPDSSRIANLREVQRYIDIYSVSYNIDNISKIKYQQAQGYSHNLFEQSIMKNSQLLKSYIDLIMTYVEEGYIQRKKDGQRLLVFCSSVHMCTLLTNKIQQLYPKLDVRRYTQEDPYENVITADICVSTPGKSSTGVDIPNLITAINTICMDSPQTNAQCLGRLRNIPNTELRYYYTFCNGISKQKQYHYNRKEYLTPLSKSYNNILYPKILTTR